MDSWDRKSKLNPSSDHAKDFTNVMQRRPEQSNIFSPLAPQVVCRTKRSHDMSSFSFEQNLCQIPYEGGRTWHSGNLSPLWKTWLAFCCWCWQHLEFFFILLFFPKPYLISCSPLDGAARIFSYLLMLWLGFEPTSESCTTLKRCATSWASTTAAGGTCS